MALSENHVVQRTRSLRRPYEVDGSKMALPKYSVVNPDGAEEAWSGPYIQDSEGKSRIASDEAQPVYKNHHITCKNIW